MATGSTPRIMGQVLIALLPGLSALVWYFGPGILINVVVAVLAAVGFEAAALQIRGRALATLWDGSAVVTGALLGLCLPPWLPIWIILAGVFFAIVFAKQVYGGLGHNVFNPAMIGYAVLILAFPLAMSLWPAPAPLSDSSPTLAELMHIKMGGAIADGMTMATPLDTFKFRGALTVEEIWQAERGFGAVSGIGWQWINLGFLVGGLWLVYRRACNWPAPAAMLASLLVLSAAFYDGGSSQSAGSPLFHLFGGATMMAAFFIVTDPVTSPASNRGQILFGIGVGAITFLIRTIGAYPDGIAFAIILMNAASPMMDHLELRPA